MDMSHDEAVGEGAHGVTEDVAGYSLDDVFYELRTVGFDTIPFLCVTDAFIGDGLTAELVFTDTGFDIGEFSARREADEEHATLVFHADVLYLSRDPLCDGSLYGTVDIPPEGYDIGIGISPGIHQRLEFFFL